MSSGIGIVEDWAFDTLSGDATLASLVTGVHSGSAPDDAVYPFVVLGEFSARPNLTLDGTVQIIHVSFEVIALDRNTESYSRVEAIHERVFQLLHQKSGVGDGGTVYGCLYESSSREAYTQNNLPIRIEAGQYRAVVR